MTRRISKAEKQRRKAVWDFNRASRAFQRLGVSTREAQRAWIAFGWVLTGYYPEYNWPEKPHRSKMHAQYGRRRNG